MKNKFHYVVGGTVLIFFLTSVLFTMFFQENIMEMLFLLVFILKLMIIFVFILIDQSIYYSKGKVLKNKFVGLSNKLYVKRIDLKFNTEKLTFEKSGSGDEIISIKSIKDYLKKIELLKIKL